MEVMVEKFSEWEMTAEKQFDSNGIKWCNLYNIRVW